MTQQQQKGTKWDAVMQRLREMHRKMNIKTSCNEIEVLNNLQNNKKIKHVLISYLANDLQPILKLSSQLSIEIRNEGNKIYKQPNSNLFESCFLYTLAIKCGESDLDLALSHANRAASLLRIGFNKVARDDCDQAIKYNHPDLFKIYERKCSLSNKSIDEMKKNLAGMEKHMKKEQARETIQQYRTRLKHMQNETLVDDQLPEKEKPWDDDLKVKQMCSPEAGRYVVAQRPIAKDERIFSEQPFAFVPIHQYGMKKYFNMDCENCGLINIWPFLCFHCRMASYCSPKCLEDHSPIHKYECPGNLRNLFSEIGIAHLSIRCLLIGFPMLLKKLRTLEKSVYKNNPAMVFEKILEICRDEYTDYFASIDPSDEFQDYARVLSLQPNLFRDEKFPTKNTPYAFTALMLTLYLKDYTTFFQDAMKKTDLMEKESDWHLLVGALILRHIGQLVSNGHAIVDFRQNIFSTESLKLMLFKVKPNGGGLHLLLKSQRIFTGIFPRISMLNHSCSGTIRNVFDRDRLTIFATEDLNEGAEIFNCYGPNYKLMSYQERQDSLRLQYNFICKCEKCLNKNDEFRFNNSVLCRYCNRRLFYPDKVLSQSDDDDDFDGFDQDDDDGVLNCSNCHKIHENEAMKSFFTLLAHQSDSNRPITMDQVYSNYLAAVSGFGPLDEIRFHITEMMLHTLITNRDAIKLLNANIPLDLAVNLMEVKRQLFGPKSIEFVEAGLFFLDIVGIYTDKGLDQLFTSEIAEHVKKITDALSICSTDNRAVIQNYISRYCYNI